MQAVTPSPSMMVFLSSVYLQCLITIRALTLGTAKLLRLLYIFRSSTEKARVCADRDTNYDST
jgi:hypothetical protein